MYLPFFCSCRSISQLSVRSLDRVKSTRHWAGNGIFQSSGMTLPVSAGFSSRACQILRSFQQRHPDLLALEADLRPGDDAPVTLAGERDLDVLLPVLEDAHGDGVTVAGQVQHKVLAGELDRIQGQPGGVDGDVIGEEIGQDAEATRAFDAELARPGPRLRLDRDIAPLDAELAGDLGAFRGLERRFQARAPLVFSTTAMRSRRAAGSPAAVINRNRSRAAVPPCFTAWTSTAESCWRSTATIRPLLRTASPFKESAVSPTGMASPVILARQGRRRQRFRGRPARVPDGDAGPRLGRGRLRRIGTPGPTRPRQRHEKCGNSDNQKPTHEASPCSRSLQGAPLSCKANLSQADPSWESVSTANGRL